MSLKDLSFSSEKKDTVTKYLVVKHIVTSRGAEHTDRLLADPPRQIGIRGSDFCTVRQGGYVLVDFGSEIQGGIELSVNGVITDSGRRKNGHIRIVFGESVSEALSSVESSSATNDHAIRDMTVETAFLSVARYGQTGFRFARIQPVDCGIEICSLKGVLEYRDIPYTGTFSCDNPRLNDIFDTAAYTVHLNMQDYIWDGIKRDRLVWIGDMHPETSTISRVFGRDPSVEKTLDYAKNAFPLDADDPWMIFPSYSFWWLIIHRDWYLHWGDLDYLLSQKDYVYPLCSLILRNIAADGTVDFGGKFFVDWSSNQTPYMEAGFRGCLILGLRAAADIMVYYGDSDYADTLRKAAETVKQIVPPFAGNKQVCAIAALAGLCSREEAVSILQTDLLQGLSTFYGFYVLELLGQTGNIDSALEILNGYWGGMLDLGATTFWEDFDIQWMENAGRIDQIVPDGMHDVHAEYGKFCYQKLRHSLCHGWSGGPCAFLSRYVLGIEILEPGCKAIRINPQPGPLRHIEGSFPTPFGTVSLEHRVSGGRLRTHIQAPKEIRILTEAKD